MSTALLLAGLGALLGFAVACAASAWHGRQPRAAQRLQPYLGRSRVMPARTGAQVAVDLFAAESAGIIGRWRDAVVRQSVRIGGMQAIWMLGLVAGLTFLGALWLLCIVQPYGIAIGAVFASGAAVLVVLALHSQLNRRWQIAFLNVFADAIDLVIRAVQSGIPVSDAIRTVGREVEEPVRSEFRAISDALDLGIDLPDALRRAADRIRLPDFDFLVTALVLQRETGGSLADILQGLSAILRRRKELRLKIKAVTAEGRMSAKIVGAIPLVAAGAMYAFDPDQIGRLLEPGGGRTMLYCAIGFLAAGMTTVHFMTRVRP